MMVTDMCQAHSGMEERIKNIDEKCDTILTELRATANGIWTRVNQHIDESPAVRTKVTELDTQLREMKLSKDREIVGGQWRIGLIVGTVMGFIGIIASVAVAMLIK